MGSRKKEPNKKGKALTKQETTSPGKPCDREYLKLLKTKAEELHQEIVSTSLPIKDISAHYARKAANNVRFAIRELENALKMYGEREW